MSHSENATVRIDDCELDSIEVDLIYPDVIRDSKIYYIRQDGTGQRARIPLKYGTTQFGQHWTEIKLSDMQLHVALPTSLAMNTGKIGVRRCWPYITNGNTSLKSTLRRAF